MPLRQTSTGYDNLSRQAGSSGANMQIVDIRIAKTRLSKLIEQALQGDPFIIAKAGKPLVKVARLGTPSAGSTGQAKRLGFMAGQISVPDDFDRMGSKTVEQLFGVQLKGD